MKYLLTIFTALTGFAALCVLLLLLWVFVAWLKGGFNVLLPGLGLIVGAPAILLGLLMVGAVLILLTALLARTISGGWRLR